MMTGAKWLPLVCFFSILLLGGLACAFTSRSPGQSSRPDPLAPLYTIRQLPAQGDWIIGERSGDRHFFAYHLATGETLALDLSQGGLASGGGEPDELPPLSTGYLGYHVTWDGRYTFNSPKRSETSFAIETADGTLQVTYRGESEFVVAAVGRDGQERVLAQGQRPSGKEVEEMLRSADGRFLYLYCDRQPDRLRAGSGPALVQAMTNQGIIPAPRG